MSLYFEILRKPLYRPETRSLKSQLSQLMVMGYFSGPGKQAYFDPNSYHVEAHSATKGCKDNVAYSVDYTNKMKIVLRTDMNTANYDSEVTRAWQFMTTPDSLRDRWRFFASIVHWLSIMTSIIIPCNLPTKNLSVAREGHSAFKRPLILCTQS